MTESDDDATLPVQKRPSFRAKRMGRYELLDRLGKGGMGIVYRARDTLLDRPVAVKLLLGDLDRDDETRKRFLREARAAGELTHRNIIQIYDFGEDRGRAFIVMELLEGASLNELLEKQPDLSLDRKLRIMIEVCDGLAFSHSRSIVHRDLKPANLFITKDGQVKVLDFGLARIVSSSLTRTGLVFGTPDYMSPEQVRGRVVDERSDIFSLGAVFYQMLSGRKPFAAKALPEVMRSVLTDEPAPLTHVEAPPSLARLITRALQKDPLKRYQKVDELLAALRGVDPAAPADSAALGDAPRQIDRYQIRERVGQGGTGPVHPARPRTTTGGPRRDSIGDLDLRVEPLGGTEGDQLAEVSLRGAGSATPDASRPRRRMDGAVVAVLLVAVSCVGGYYAFRVLDGGQPTASAPIEEARAVDHGAGDEPVAPAPLEPPQVEPPPVEPTPVEPVMLQVTSTPSGAAVSLDGQDTGQTTPASFPLDERLPDTIALSLEGYQPISQSVPAVEGEPVELAFELTREETFGRVVLSGPYRFEVWDDERRVREPAAEHDLTLPTGTTTLRILNPGYFLDRRFRVEVVEGGREQLIAPALGSLTVFSNPGNCEIFVDSASIAYPPITQREVAPGAYTVSRRCADERENREQRVTVVSNQDERVTLAPVER